MTEPEVPEELRDPFRTASSPYAVPLTTLVGGAYVCLTDQVEIQPASSPALGALGGTGLGSDDD